MEENKTYLVCNNPLVKNDEEFGCHELVLIPIKLKIVEIYNFNYSCPEYGEQDVPDIKKEKASSVMVYIRW